MAEALLAPLIGKGLLFLAVLAAGAFVYRKFKTSIQTEDRNATLETTAKKMEQEARVDNRPRADAGAVRDRMRQGDL